MKRIANLVPVSGEPEIARENLQRMVATLGVLTMFLADAPERLERVPRTAP